MGSMTTNKYIGIGKVDDEPSIKYVSQTESYLVEFDLEIIKESESELAPLVHPIVVRNENLALYLKDTLKKGMRIYLECELLTKSKQHSRTKTSNKKVEVAYYIDATEIQLIDTIQRTKYPDDIKKIR